MKQAKAQAETIRVIENTIPHLQDSLYLSPIAQHAISDWSMYPDIPNELYTMGVKVGHVKVIAGKNSADTELSLYLL